MHTTPSKHQVCDVSLPFHAFQPAFSWMRSRKFTIKTLLFPTIQKKKTGRGNVHFLWSKWQYTLIFWRGWEQEFYIECEQRTGGRGITSQWGVISNHPPPITAIPLRNRANDQHGAKVRLEELDYGRPSQVQSPHDKVQPIIFTLGILASPYPMLVCTLCMLDYEASARLIRRSAEAQRGRRSPYSQVDLCMNNHTI